MTFRSCLIQQILKSRSIQVIDQTVTKCKSLLWTSHDVILKSFLSRLLSFGKQSLRKRNHLLQSRHTYFLLFTIYLLWPLIESYLLPWMDQIHQKALLILPYIHLLFHSTVFCYAHKLQTCVIVQKLLESQWMLDKRW